MIRGRLFQSLGATKEKARSPFDLQQEKGTDKSNWLQDLNDLEAVYGWMRSQI